jgi:hypothetical protein
MYSGPVRSSGCRLTCVMMLPSNGGQQVEGGAWASKARYRGAAAIAGSRRLSGRDRCPTISSAIAARTVPSACQRGRCFCFSERHTWMALWVRDRSYRAAARVIATKSAGEELIAGEPEGTGCGIRGDDRASTAKQRTASQAPRANCLRALRGEGIPFPSCFTGLSGRRGKSNPFKLSGCAR